MKKLKLISALALVLIASQLNPHIIIGKSIHNDLAMNDLNTSKETFSIRIFKTTTKQQLGALKEKAGEAGITVEYNNLQFVNGEIDAISLKVDCNDGYSGSVTVTDIPDSGIGFIRDYSENSDAPFVIGKVFEQNTMKESIDSDSQDYNMPFNKENKVIKNDDFPLHDHEIEILIGLNNYLTPDNQLPDHNNENYSLDPITSWTYAINSSHKVKFSKIFSTSFQFGLQWYNFALANENYQIVRGPEEVLFVDTNDLNQKINPSRSKLNITYLNVGIVPMIKLGESNNAFRLGAGVYGGYRIGSKSKFKYDDDGKDVSKNNFHLNSLHYGVKAQVGWKGIDLFATYDLNSLYIKGRGPELNAFSFGIIL